MVTCHNKVHEEKKSHLFLKPYDLCDSDIGGSELQRKIDDVKKI